MRYDCQVTDPLTMFNDARDHDCPNSKCLLKAISPDQLETYERATYPLPPHNEMLVKSGHQPRPPATCNSTVHVHESGETLTSNTVTARIRDSREMLYILTWSGHQPARPTDHLYQYDNAQCTLHTMNPHPREI